MRVPDVPGCVVVAPTAEEAVRRTPAAIALHLEAASHRGERLEPPKGLDDHKAAGTFGENVRWDTVEVGSERRLSPRDFMRARRPELYSDSVTEREPEVDVAFLHFTLSQVTERKEEVAFEHFCRKLAEKGSVRTSSRRPDRPEAETAKWTPRRTRWRNGLPSGGMSAIPRGLPENAGRSPSARSRTGDQRSGMTSGRSRRRAGATRSRTSCPINKSATVTVAQRPLEEDAFEENGTFTPPDLLPFQNGDGTRHDHTSFAPPDRREGRRSDPRIPTPPHARADAPSSPPRDEPSRAGADHRVHGQPARSDPTADPPPVVTMPRHWRRSTRRRNSPELGACGSLKTRTLHGYILSPSGSWLDPG